MEELEVRAEDFAEDFAHLLQILPAHNRAIAAAAAAAVAHVAVVADCLHHGHGHDHYDHHRLSVSQNGRVSCDPAGSAITSAFELIYCSAHVRQGTLVVLVIIPMRHFSTCTSSKVLPFINWVAL